MRFSFPPAVSAALLALVVAMPAMAEDGDDDTRRIAPREKELSPFCACWYEGYEDGLEFRWDNRQFAEDFGVCVKAGQLTGYELGFKASEARQERRCPR